MFNNNRENSITNTKPDSLVKEGFDRELSNKDLKAIENMTKILNAYMKKPGKFLEMKMHLFGYSAFVDKDENGVGVGCIYDPKTQLIICGIDDHEGKVVPLMCDYNKDYPRNYNLFTLGGKGIKLQYPLRVYEKGNGKEDVLFYESREFRKALIDMFNSSDYLSDYVVETLKGSKGEDESFLEACGFYENVRCAEYGYKELSE